MSDDIWTDEDSRREAEAICRDRGGDPDRVIILGPPDWRDEVLALAADHRTTVLELLRRRVELNLDATALRREMRHLRRLLIERVARPGGDWLTVDEAGQRLKMSRKAVYCELMRSPTGQLAQASSRLGRRLRFSREGIDLLLRKSPGTARVRPRVPSPGKGTGR